MLPSARIDSPLHTTSRDVTDPDAVVQCDRDRLQQVLLNLGDNALAHTTSRGVVRIAVRRLGTGGVQFEVADAGPGIPDDLRDRLFEPFASARNDGTGLGLAVAQRIVTAHGSRIRVENPPGGGAVFRFELPEIGVPQGEGGDGP